MTQARKALPFVSLVLSSVILFTVFVGLYRPPSVLAHTPFPYVSGTHILDASGHELLLRGAQIDSSFHNYQSWFNNNDVARKFSPAVLNAMKSWHMNALRITLSNWIYNKDPVHYLTVLDQVVQQANQDGLYTILNLHDDDQGGSPYGSGAATPKPESIAFWTIFAAHYASNPMVMFDAFNEPGYPDGPTWLNGGGTITGSTGKSFHIVGMQALVQAIRATGAKQIIVIGGLKYPLKYAAKTGTQLHITGSNLVYTKHDYSSIASGNPTAWDAEVGYFKDLSPIYYGEWALLPNPKASQAQRCLGATMQNADQKVTAFLNYMQQNHMSWTAWQFDVDHLILSYTTFQPTRLDDPKHPWVCPTPAAAAGMGTLVKNYLLSH